MIDDNELLKQIGTKAAALPKLRDSLLKIVDDINQVLKGNGYVRPAGRGRVAARGKPRGNGGATRGMKMRKPKMIGELPREAVKIPGVSPNWMFLPGKGVISCASNKRGDWKLLGTPKNRTWGVRAAKGNKRFGLSVNRLNEKLGFDSGL